MLNTCVTTEFWTTSAGAGRIRVSTRAGAKSVPFDHHASDHRGITTETLVAVTRSLLMDEWEDVEDVTVEYVSGPHAGPGTRKTCREYWILAADVTFTATETSTR